MIPTIISTIAQTKVFTLFAPITAMTPQMMLMMPPKAKLAKPPTPI